MRLTSLDQSVSTETVTAVIAAAGGCPAEDVRVDVIHRNQSGLGTVWAKCPLTATKLLTAAGCVLIGWSSARGEALSARLCGCYRCLKMGHVRQKCPCDTNRGGRCYTCGGA